MSLLKKKKHFFKLTGAPASKKNQSSQYSDWWIPLKGSYM